VICYSISLAAGEFAKGDNYYFEEGETHYQCGEELCSLLHYLFVYTISVLFGSVMYRSINCCCLKALFFFCLRGVRSAVMQRFPTLSGLVVDLSLILFFKIAIFSSA